MRASSSVSSLRFATSTGDEETFRRQRAAATAKKTGRGEEGALNSVERVPLLAVCVVQRSGEFRARKFRYGFHGNRKTSCQSKMIVGISVERLPPFNSRQ